MKFNAWTIFLYAGLILVGGVIGHLKAQSAVSLISGLVFSIALFTSGWLMFKGKKSGYLSAIVLTVVLGVFFIYRYTLTQAFMPAGLMTILTITVLIILLGSKCRCCKKCC